MVQSLRSAWNEGTYVLREAGIDSARSDAKALLSLAWGADLPVGLAGQLSVQQMRHYLSLVSQRAQRTPLQHLSGKMYFRYLQLQARPGVFVTRPETELVAQAGIDWLRGRQCALALDLCTGSGAIALAIATEVAGSKVIGFDISARACGLANENVQMVARQHQGNIDVEIVQADIIAGTELEQWYGKADLVISNPPYVPADQITQSEALSDPPLALYGGGQRGLDLPCQVLARAAHLLRPGARVVVEHDESQGEPLREYAHELGFTCIETHKDLNGRDRYLQAHWPQI